MAAARARNAITTKVRMDERDVLRRLTRRRKLARADARRAEIILRAAEGLKQLLALLWQNLANGKVIGFPNQLLNDS
jgi:hypothetical protein